MQLTSLTFKAIILTTVAVILEQAEFDVSAAAKHAVFLYGGLKICFPKNSHTMEQVMHHSISVIVKKQKEQSRLL